MNTFNDALKELDDIKHLDLEVTNLRTQQYDATMTLQASYNSDASKTFSASYNSNALPTNPLKAEQDHAQISEKLQGAQKQLDALNDVERPRKKKLYDDAVAAAAPFIKLRNDQVDCMALALWIKFVAISGVDPRNQVARGRLFLSWVAYSVRYDLDSKAKNAEGVENKTRPTADTVMTGMEICGGYSELSVKFSIPQTFSAKPKPCMSVVKQRKEPGIRRSLDEATPGVSFLPQMAKSLS